MRLRLQLTGGEDVAAELINRLSAIAGVERVEEVGDLMPHMDDVDSSSAGLPDDEGPGVHQIELVTSVSALDSIRATAVAIVRERGAGLEFDEPA